MPDGRLLIARPDCAAAGAAYVPGVDAQGNAVAPADLPAAAPVVKPEEAPIEIDSRVARQFGAGVPGARVGRQVLGQVTVRDGHAYFNGQPLAPEASAAVTEACRAGK